MESEKELGLSLGGWYPGVKTWQRVIREKELAGGLGKLARCAGTQVILETERTGLSISGREGGKQTNKQN